VVLLFLFNSYSQAQTDEQPNILFIVCDDLNFLGLGTMVDTTLHTPFIDELVSESTVFTNAHANAAGCGPSRASMFAGVLPQTSGHSGYRMSQNSWLDNPYLSSTKSVFRQFLDNGYGVYAGGKIYHAFRHRDEDFSDYYEEPKQGPYAPGSGNHPDLPDSFDEYDLSFARLENIPEVNGISGWRNPDGTPFFYESEENRDPMGDEMTAEYCVNFLEDYANSESEQPFFLSAGFYNPHQPFHVPGKYWDLYDFSNYQFDFLGPDSTIPTLTALTNRYNRDSNKAFDAMRAESPSEDPNFYLRQYIHGYYASVSFIDDQLGAILTALEQTELDDNTIIIFTSDHGFHLGSKGLVEKATLWNDATAVPFVVKVPGQTQQFVDKPVSLVDLYPTLIEFAGIPEPETHDLDGVPVQDVMAGTEPGSAIIMGVAKEVLEVGELTQNEHSHHAYIRSNFKYIHYSSGEDELYKISDDFRELNNLSSSLQYQGVRNILYKKLKEEVGYLRPPMPEYDCLYYGDFSQDLNGWGPSEPNDDYYLETNEILGSQHLVISGNAQGPITSKNLTYREEGLHELSLRAYSTDENANLTVRIRYNELVYLDTTFALNPSAELYTGTFDVAEPFPAFDDLIILIRSQNEVHLDDVFLQNVSQRNDARVPCETSEALQTNVPINQLQNKSLQARLNQQPVSCTESSGSALQLWQHFSPAEGSGIIGVNINGFDPVIEVFTGCSETREPLFCSDARSNSREFIYMPELDPQAEYQVRITSKKDLPYSQLVNSGVKSLFINAQPAEILIQDFEVLNENDELSFGEQAVFSYPMSEANFLFVDSDTNDSTVVNLGFSSSLSYPLSLFPNLEAGHTYRVSAQYVSNVIDVDIPFGEPRTFIYTSSGSANPEFTVYPNPSYNEGTLSLLFKNQDEASGELILYDLAGRKLYSQNVQQKGGTMYLTNLPHLSVGTYVLVFSEGELRRSRQLLFIQ
jgi:arylsulfatase A-like enzyme